MSRKKPVGRPGTRLCDYIEDLGWNRLGLYPSEMQSVLVDREMWQLNLELLTAHPQEKAGEEKRNLNAFLLRYYFTNTSSDTFASFAV